MISRTISYRSSEVMPRLYKSLVRPHLEFCVSAWSSYNDKDKQLLERVQHRFTRMIPGLKQLPTGGPWIVVTWRVTQSGWSVGSFQNLQKNDQRSVVTVCSRLTVATEQEIIQPNILKNRCRLELSRRFFFARVVDQQHDIDSIIILALNKCSLQRIRCELISFFGGRWSAKPWASSVPAARGM